MVNRDRLTEEADSMELGESDKVNSDKLSDLPGGEVTSRDENPPDGCGKIGEDTEWREGPHLIIERGRGPGNEVRYSEIES